jgi:hypothetical protein
MTAAAEPLIKLEPGGKAPIIGYKIPESTSYSGRNFIELRFADGDRALFKPAAFTKPKTSRAQVKNLDVDAVKTAVVTGMKTGFTDQRLFPNIRSLGGDLRLADRAARGASFASSLPISAKLAQLDPDEVAHAMVAGKRLNVHRSLYGTLTYNYVDEPATVRPRLFLIETYELVTFPATYGAGRVLSTFTLLPGEKTRISVRSYTKTESTAKSASSILDSFSEESADDFETSVQNEQSDKASYQETFEYHAEADATASWGWGSANVSGGVKGATNAAREQFSKNVTNAAQKHSAKASAKREVQVNTSYEVKQEIGEEISTEREIQNVNMARALNFVFRQMNQEFFTFLVLTDVRVAFFNGFAESRREVSVSQLDALLAEFVVDAKQAAVRSAIVAQLQSVLDYQDNAHAVVEEKVVTDQDRYLRIKRDLVSTFQDNISGETFALPGVIVGANKTVMRTEGVIVEAILGTGEALDEYAKSLQALEVRRREAEVAKLEAEAAQARLLNQVVEDGDDKRAALLTNLVCPCNEERWSLTTKRRCHEQAALPAIRLRRGRATGPGRPRRRRHRRAGFLEKGESKSRRRNGGPGGGRLSRLRDGGGRDQGDH